jgi:hypothetical protein
MKSLVRSQLGQPIKAGCITHPVILFKKRKTVSINTKNDTLKTALHYIEMYANPIRMAIADLEKGEIKDVNVLFLISQIMSDEASHHIEREVSY